MSSTVTRMFATHEEARHAAGALGQAGIGRDQVSLVDQHGDGQQAGTAGTLMTVQAPPGREGDIERLLSHGAATAQGAPEAGVKALGGAAPAYIAGATANIGVPGQD